jgi:hypothetical protein
MHSISLRRNAFDDNWLKRDVVSACKLTASRYAEPTRSAAVAARDQSRPAASQAC